MINIKAKREVGGTVGVNGKYEGDLNDLLLEMTSILSDFGTGIVKIEKGIKKEEVENILDTMVDISKNHIKYK